MFSFDSPLSSGGLYLNLATWQAFSERHLPLDAERSGGKLYLWEKWHKARSSRLARPASDLKQQHMIRLIATYRNCRLQVMPGGGTVQLPNISHNH